MSQGMSSTRNSYDLVVVGAGLGGLLSAALATQIGLKTIVLEQLSFIGGRCTAIPYKNFEIPTGAVHMIPYGKKGPMGKILFEQLHLDKYGLQVKPTQYFTCWKWIKSPKEIRTQHFLSALRPMPGLKRKILLIKMIRKSKPKHTAGLTFAAYLKKITSDSKFFAYFQAIIGFSISTLLDELPAREGIEFFVNQYWYERPAIPLGGYRQLISILKKYIEEKNTILVNHRVTEITKQENTYIIAVETTKEKYQLNATYVISDAGPRQTARLIPDIKPELREKIEKMPASRGFGIVYALDSPILGHSGITLTPGYQTLCGLVEPSHNSSELAPADKHLLISHHIIPNSLSIEQAIKIGRTELLEAYPLLKECGMELCVHSFSGDWGVNKTIQGFEVKTLEKEGLWLVGDGSKSLGNIMTEGVADSAIFAINELKKLLESN